MIVASRWPRLFALSGICLTCAGILLLWMALTHHHLLARVLYVLGGLCSGCGVALVQAQCEVLLAQYFRLKLSSINVVLQIATYLGYIFTPLVLGHYINVYGLVHVVIWYHLYILAGAGVCLLFRKPDYLKRKSVYNSVKVAQVSDEDEEDVFSAKRSTELKEARAAEPSALQENYEPIPGTSDLVEVEVHRPQAGWERFSDDDDDEEDLHEFKNNLAAPKELFTDLHLNNNNTYSFDNSDVTTAFEDDTANIFMPTGTAAAHSYGFLREGSFYKSVLLQTALKYSRFTFYTLFPSTLYFGVSLHIEDVAAVLSYLFIISSIIILAARLALVAVNKKNRAIFVVVASWIGTIGYLMISDVPSEVGKVLGAGLAVISVNVLQQLTEPLVTANVKSEPNRMFVVLNALAALGFAFLSIGNITYTNCFRLMGLLQFANGSVWFCNFVYKKIVRAN